LKHSHRWQGWRAGLIMGTALLLGACSSQPPAPSASRDDLRDFIMDARFALRLNRPEQAPQSAAGRLTWEHRQQGERILIASPLGYGLAEIETTPEIAHLRTADGKTRSSADPDELMEAATGERLPVSRLPAWLLGQPGKDGQLRRDPQQRPQQLHEAGWQVDYAYDDESAASLPARVTLRRADEIELRLRIEEWRTAP
jgi:outer membrane lipoprotein LolB